jgi:asparagine N-glycosylation enzyme membrane subunit Stt3
MDVRTAFALLASLLFGLMFFQARRFVEYFPPFVLLFAAFAWAPLLSKPQLDPDLSADSGPYRFAPLLRKSLPALVLLLVVAASIARSVPAAREALDRSKPYTLYAGASKWLQENTSDGDRIFQTDWDDFPRLFFYNTHNIYLIGLDPTYMQLYDAALYDQWVNVTQGNVINPSQVIFDTFGARYIHTDLTHRDFLTVARNDPGLKEVYRDDQAVLFKVLDSP